MFAYADAKSAKYTVPYRINGATKTVLKVEVDGDIAGLKNVQYTIISSSLVPEKGWPSKTRPPPFTMDSKTGVFSVGRSATWFRLPQHSVNFIIEARNSRNESTRASVSFVGGDRDAMVSWICASDACVQQQSASFGRSLVTAQTAYTVTQYAAEKESMSAALAAPIKEGLWSATPYVHVAIQMRNERGELPAKARQVVATLTASASLTKLLQDTGVTKTSAAATCTTGSQTGMCIVKLAVPLSWFGLISKDDSVSVTANPAGNAKSIKSLGVIKVHPTRSVDMKYVARTMALELPTEGLRPGQQASIKLISGAIYATASWQVTITVNAPLEITNVVLDKNKWSGNVKIRSKQSVDINAILANDKSTSTDKMTALEVLTILQIQVASSAKTTSTPAVECIMYSLESMKEKGIVARGAKALVVDRSWDGKASLKKTGSAHVIAVEKPAAIFLAVQGDASPGPYPSLVNTAVLNGKPVEKSLKTALVGNYGTILKASNIDVKCHTVGKQSSAVRVDPKCTKVYFDGKETGGAVKVDVVGEVVSNNGQVAVAATPHSTLAFGAWYPYEVAVHLSNPHLLPIANWTVSDGKGSCVPAFQRTRVSVLASFAMEETATPTVVDASAVVKATLKVADTQFAELKDGTLQGKATGNTTVTVSLPPGVKVKANPAKVSVGGRMLAPNKVTALNSVTAVNIRTYAAKEMILRDVKTSPFRAVSKNSSSTSQYTFPSIELVELVKGPLDFVKISTAVEFNDGSEMLLTPEDGVDVSSTGKALTFVKGTAYHKITGGDPGTNDYTAVWKPSCNKKSTTLAQGQGRVAIAVQLPTKVALTIAGKILTQPADPVTHIGGGLPVKVKFAVALQYPGNVAIDVTTKSDTVYDLSKSNGLFTVCQKATDKTCSGEGVSASSELVPISKASGGKGTLLIKSANLTVSVEITLVTTTGFQVQVNPWPKYSNSVSKTLTHLSRYKNKFSATIIRQQGQAVFYATLSDGRSVDVTRHQAVALSFTSASSGLVDKTLKLISNQVLVLAGTEADMSKSGDRSLKVVAEYKGFSPVSTPIIVSNRELDIVSLVNLQLNKGVISSGTQTFSVVRGGTLKVVFGASFSDGTQHPSVKTENSVLLENLFAYKSADLKTVLVSNDGTATLLANNHVTVNIVVSVKGRDTDTALVLACNLLPDVGDVDLGLNSGIAFPRTTVGGISVVEVRANTGQKALGAVELIITFNPKYLDVVTKSPGVLDVQTSSVFSGGIFEAVHDPPGVLKLGGIPSVSRSFKGTQLPLATVKFKGVAAGLTDMEVTISTLSDTSTNSVDIGGLSGGGKSIAGSIVAPVQRSRSRRALFGGVDEVETMTQAVSPAPAVPFGYTRERRTSSSSCKQQRGDVNSDCSFDIKDVQFLQLYLSELPDNFATAQGKEVKAKATVKYVDADGSGGAPSAADARYLSRVNFNLLRFVTKVEVTTPTDVASEGLFRITATVLQRGDTDSPANTTKLVAVLGHSDKAFVDKFDATVVKTGRQIKTSSTSPLIIVEMAEIGPFFGPQGTLDQPPLRCRASPLPSSCTAANAGPVTTRFVLDANKELCVPLNTSCSLVGYNASALCSDFCVPQLKQTLALKTDIVAKEIGIAFLLATFNSQGDYESGRDVFLSQSRCAGCSAHEYPSPLKQEISLRAYPGAKEAKIVLDQPNGYTPWIKVENELASSQAVNKFSPIFESPSTFTISENPTVPLVLTTVKAIDRDVITFKPAPNMTYSMDSCSCRDSSGKEKEGVCQFCPFTLDTNTGVFTLAKSLDYETPLQQVFTITISATDNAPPKALSAQQTIAVTVTDANDNKPIIDPVMQDVVCVPPSSFSDYGRLPIAGISATDKDTGRFSVLQFAQGNESYQLKLGQGSNQKQGEIRVDSKGKIYSRELSNGTFPITHVGSMQAFDGGIPPLTTGTSMKFSDCEGVPQVVFLMTSPSHAVFVSGWKADVVHPCLVELQNLLQRRVTLREVNVRSKGSLTELTTFVESAKDDNSAEAFLTELQVATILATKGSVGAAASRASLACPLSVFVARKPDSSLNSHVGHVHFYTDSACSVPKSVEYEGSPGDCFATGDVPFSARVYCSGSDGIGLGSNPGFVSARAYANTGCNMRSLELTLSNNYSQTDSARCFAVRPQGQSSAVIYARASCSMKTTTTMTSTTNTSTTTTGTTTTGTTTTTTVTSSTVTRQAYVIAEDKELSFAHWIFIIVAILIAVCWLLVMLYYLRHRRQSHTLENTAAMIIGDKMDNISFGTPEPFRKELLTMNNFSGGEVDPVTGEMKVYGEDAKTGEVKETKFDAGVWERTVGRNGLRENPLFSPLDQEQESSIGDYVEVNDKEGDDDSLSDFDEMDFENFADSLLREFENQPMDGGAGSIASLDLDALMINDDDFLDLDNLGAPSGNPVVASVMYDEARSGTSVVANRGQPTRMGGMGNYLADNSFEAGQVQLGGLTSRTTVYDNARGGSTRSAIYDTAQGEVDPVTGATLGSYNQNSRRTVYGGPAQPRPAYDVAAGGRSTIYDTASPTSQRNNYEVAQQDDTMSTSAMSDLSFEPVVARVKFEDVGRPTPGEGVANRRNNSGMHFF